MDRIDILHKISEKHGKDIFWSREGKLRKALEGSELTSQDVEKIVSVCSYDRKLTKIILSEPDSSKTQPQQDALRAKLKDISPLTDIHTSIYNSGRSVTVSEGELDDGRFVYTMVPARKQCLHLVRPLSAPAYTVTVPDTVTIGNKDHKIVSIEDGCFEGNAKIESVILPSTLETIGNNAFCNCSSLRECILPRHLKSIGSNAFAFTALEDVEFQDYLEEVGTMAFYRCRSLKKVVISKRTSQIGVGAFAGCDSLENIEVADKNGRFMFEDGVLYSRKQDRIVQVVGTFKGKLSPPRSLLAIEQYAADGCTGIDEIDLPVSLTTIGACAFRNCSSVTKIKFPNTLERIGERAFENCSSIRKIDVPASLRTIGKKAFSGCSGIETADIDGALSYKGLNVFEGCTGLNRVTVKKGSEFSDADFPKQTRIKFAHQ